MFLSTLLALLPQSAPPEQEPPVQEPRFYTAFGRTFVGNDRPILLADVLSTERIGPTSRLLVTLTKPDWIQGRIEMKPLVAIGSRNGSFVPGNRVLIFLRRTPETLQLWIDAGISGAEPDFAEKLGQVREYLRISKLPNGRRFDATREYLEQMLRNGRSWGRTNALRELTEIVLDHPSRFEPSRFRLWERHLRRAPGLAVKVREIEREWRKSKRS